MFVDAGGLFREACREEDNVVVRFGDEVRLTMTKPEAQQMVAAVLMAIGEPSVLLERLLHLEREVASKEASRQHLEREYRRLNTAVEAAMATDVPIKLILAKR